MLKLQIISDIHTEFHYKDNGRKILQRLAKEANDVDVLLVCGDLSTKRGLKYALSILCDNFEDVVYVTGNHEYYDSSLKETHDLLNGCSIKHSNLHWLNNSTATIKEQRFVGTTLWFPDSFEARMHTWWMTDFDTINGFRDWIWSAFNENKRFLENTVEENDIVLTHHLPHVKSIHPMYQGQVTNCFFLADVSRTIVENKPKLFCHGHTHKECDYVVDNTRIICNPIGYPGENIQTKEIIKTIEI